MGRYECKVCHGTCDPGELIGGVCRECADEEQQRQIRTSAVVKMMNSQYYQMGLRLEAMKFAGND